MLIDSHEIECISILGETALIAISYLLSDFGGGASMSDFSEKFFSERELAVIDQDALENGGIRVKAGQWFEAVKGVLDLLEVYQHDNFGTPSFPTFDGLKSDCSRDNDRCMGDDVWFFRGQEDSSFAFTSSLYRRLTQSLSKEKNGGGSKINLSEKPPKFQVLEKAMSEAEAKLLEKASNAGIGRGLTGLETLTLLQHHGTPTRLIDVTSDWRVALFFACKTGDSKDGRLFLIRTSQQRWQEFPREKECSTGNKKLVWENYKKSFHQLEATDPRYPWASGVWPILLPFSDPRMIAQKGFFLVGGVPSLRGVAFLNTSHCRQCHKNMCSCGKNDYGAIESSLSTPEFRDVTSLSIKFAARPKQLADLKKPIESERWTAIGYSIRVPREYKVAIREILSNDGLTADTLYPPLRETARLFDHIVTQSFQEWDDCGV